MIAQLLFNVLLTAADYLPLAVAYFFVLAVCRYFHFAVGWAFVAAPYAVWALAPQEVSWQSLAMLVAAVVSCAALLGAILEAKLLQPLAARGASPLHLAMVSLALLFLGQNAIGLWGAGRAVRLDFEVLSLGATRIATAVLNHHQLLAIAINVAVIGLVGFAWRASLVGLVFRAVQEDPNRAAAVGIDSHRWRCTASACAFGLAALAGVTHGFDNLLAPDKGFDAAFIGMSAVIVGGRTYLWQPLLGVVVVSVAKTLGGYWLPGNWEPSLTFAVCLIALGFSPEWNRLSIAELR